MRHFRFLIGTLGGALGGFILSNRTLRRKLQQARTPSEAAKILGKEMQRSGREVAKEVQDLLDRPELQEKFDEWKSFFLGEGARLKKHAGRVAKRAARSAKVQAASALRKARRTLQSKIS